MVPLRVHGATIGKLVLEGSSMPSEEVPILAALVSAAVQQMSRLEKLATVSRSKHAEHRELVEATGGDDGDAVVARSEVMRDAIRKVRLVARHDTTVLLQGESGTGKEVFARRLHRLSSRARGPFVAVNCGAIPESLEESELFGHEKGSFTGAQRRHIGKFRRASGGTIFLDEIAELSPSAQVKLLRALQEGEIEPVGAESTVKVDVRVIAATHRALDELVASGTFREDLYYRINVFPIALPGLRERREDVPALAHAILQRLAKRLGLPVPAVSNEMMHALCSNDWPGNVRELENVLERAMIQTPPGESLSRVEFRQPLSRDDVVAPTVESFESITRRALVNALRETRGKIYGPNGAAALLGLKPSTLQSKMVRLGIDRGDFAS